MEQEYVYSDEQEEGLTFKKIGQFIKKAWLRVVVYMAAMVLLTTAVAVPIKVFYKSEPIARTTIEYIYPGIEEGLNPGGGQLNTDNIISPTVLNKAVSEAKLGKIIKDISTLRDAMRVEAVLTDEYVRLVEAAANGDTAAANTLRNYTMHPTRFNIIISDPSALGLSDDQAKLLLNKIISCYYVDFQKNYSVLNMFDSAMFVLSQNELLEFTDMYDMYIASLNAVRTYLSDLASENPTFTSYKNNTTLVQLLSELTLLTSSYERFNAFISANNVWRNIVMAKNNLVASKKTTKIYLDATDQKIELLKQQIADIKYELQPDIEAPSGGQILVNYPEYPEVYNTLNLQLQEAITQKLEYQIQYDNIEMRLTQIEEGSETSDADKKLATKEIAELETASAAFIEKVNSTIVDYYDTTFVSDSVRQTQQPVVTRRGASFSLLIVYMVALIVALLAACVVTGVKVGMKKADKALPPSAKEDGAKQDDASDK